MASTRNLNSMNNYKVEQRQERQQKLLKLDQHLPKPRVCILPDAGVPVGMMTGGYNNNALSKNAADVESYLFGIGQTNLVAPRGKTSERRNELKHHAFFQRNSVFIPSPLVIDREQRPMIFRR